MHDDNKELPDLTAANAIGVSGTARPGAMRRSYEGECKTKAPDHEARLAAIAARVEREMKVNAKKVKR